ncbi:CDP-alcohol phosphatidyltransferase family protein, partial [Streptomyces sp. NPDC052127]|uniref:CDP-alcohol phosphatidyltransferase family protein n=1 Tax=Streptomyces sp. NPDC052127 TaxID=3155679 RepID=UPI00341F9047
MVAAPVLEELREVCQPQAKLASRNGEHWAGRLYMRRVSLRFTRQLVRTRVTPDQLTWTMVVCGVLSGAALLVPGLAGAVLAALLMQLFLLFDCVDGEVARWKGQNSATGIYVDRLGAYLADAALMIGFGFRAAESGLGGWAGFNGWVSLGLATALGVVLLKASTDLVDVAAPATSRAACPCTPRTRPAGVQLDARHVPMRA